MPTEKSTPSYLQKFKGAKVKSGIPYPKWYEPLISGLGGSITIAVLYLLSVDLDIVACFIVPFGASCALVFGVPAAPVSQPRNVIAGHVLSALIGLVIFLIFGQLRHDDALRHSNLDGGEAYTVGYVHRFDHIVDELLRSRAHTSHAARFLA